MTPQGNEKNKKKNDEAKVIQYIRNTAGMKMKLIAAPIQIGDYTLQRRLSTVTGVVHRAGSGAVTFHVRRGKVLIKSDNQDDIVHVGRVIFGAIPTVVALHVPEIHGTVPVFTPILLDSVHVRNKLAVSAAILRVPAKTIVANALDAFQAKFYTPTATGLSFQTAMARLKKKNQVFDAGCSIFKEMASAAFRIPVPSRRNNTNYATFIPYEIVDILTEEFDGVVCGAPPADRLMPIREWRACLHSKMHQIASWLTGQKELKEPDVLRKRALRNPTIAQLATGWTGWQYYNIQKGRKAGTVSAQYRTNLSVPNFMAINEALARYMRSTALRTPQSPPGKERPKFLYRGMTVVGPALKTHGYIDWAGYIATSTNEEVSKRFLGEGNERKKSILLRFDINAIPEGTPWIWFDAANESRGRRRTTVLALEKEHEVLLPPGRILLIPATANVQVALQTVRELVVGKNAKLIKEFAAVQKDTRVDWDTPQMSTMWLCLALLRTKMDFRMAPRHWMHSNGMYDALVVPDLQASSMVNPASPMVRRMFPARNRNNATKPLAPYETLSTLFK